MCELQLFSVTREDAIVLNNPIVYSAEPMADSVARGAARAIAEYALFADI